MRIKQALTRALMNWLPPCDQEQMMADLLRRICSDLPPAEQKERIDWLEPRLTRMIREGRFGLALVIYTHLLRLPPLRWQENRVKPANVSPEGRLARQAAEGVAND